MATVRNTADEVREILLEVPTSVDLLPFINKAAIFVKRVEANNTCGLEEEDFKAIECLLTAHLYLMNGGQITSKKVGRSSKTYAVTVGKGIEGTSFGTMAKQLDCTGTLAVQTYAKVCWLGTED